MVESSFSFRSCENMLWKTGDRAARTARWAPMLPSEALMMMSVWMLSVNIRPRDARAVAFDLFRVNPSAQMEQGSPPCVFHERYSIVKTGMLVKKTIIVY